MKIFFLSNKYLFIAFIFLLAGIVIQHYEFLNWDAAWGLEAASRLLQGRTYLTGFYDNNPPMVFFLSTIPVMIAQHFSWNVVIVMRAIFLLLGLVSILLCIRIAKGMVNHVLQGWLLIGLAYVYFLVPASLFGEREHFMMMMTMPYIWMVAARMMNHKLTVCQKLLAGIMAGVGLSLKPYFLFTPLFLEIYLLWKKRQWFSWIRLETCMIVGVFILYGLAMILFTPEYFSYVLPMVRLTYLNYGNQSLWNLLSSVWTLLLYATIVLYVVNAYRSQFRPLLTVFFLSVVGFWLSYAFQKGFPYQAIPMHSMAVLMLIILLYETADSLYRKATFPAFIQLIVILVVGLGLSFDTTMILNRSAIRNYSQPMSYMNQIIDLMRAEPENRPVFFIDNVVYPNAIGALYAHRQLGMRAISLWTASYLESAPSDTVQYHHVAEWTRDRVIEDFERAKPHLVFVQVRGLHPHRQSFHYLEFLNQAPRFRALWKRCHYYQTIVLFDVYQCNEIVVDATPHKPTRQQRSINSNFEY